MTQNPKIYQINKNHLQLRKKTDTKSIIETIIVSYQRKLGIKKSQSNLDINSFKRDDVLYYLYIYNTEETTSKWQGFLPDELTGESDFTQQQISLLLFAETPIELYCIVGGHAYKMIVPFINQSFGLNTYARIMQPEADQLSSIRSRGITGYRAGMSEQFRDNYRIIDFIKFGKIPKEIDLILSADTSILHFGFLQSKSRDLIQIRVSKSFKIKKAVNFEKLHEIFKELDTISELAPSDYLSSYKEIQDEDFIENTLRPELIKLIFNDIQGLGRRNNPTIRRFEHDFCNPNDIEGFYEADSYDLKELTEKKGYVTFENVSDRRWIYDTVLRRAVSKHGENDQFNFMVYLQGVRVTCIKNKKATVGSSFLFHITTEFTLRKKPYFLVDTNWYNLKNSFVHDLKTSAVHVLKTYKAPENIIFLPWNKDEVSTEGEYNLKYDQHDNYFVIDTIIVDGLELCDILFYDDNTLYLIHVKYGFGSKLRELHNQINISARRLKDVLGTPDKSILTKVYKQLLSKDRSTNGLDIDEFVGLFNKKIVFVLAFTSHLKDDLLVEENIDQFSSNIAKFSLVQCSSDLRADYFDLLTHQIKRN